jgi:UDP-glucose 4-epimerase
MAHAIDMGGYYRIPADNRDLNYAKYFSEGEIDISSFDDYTSHNTRRLSLDEIKSLLLTLDYIKAELNA